MLFLSWKRSLAGFSARQSSKLARWGTRLHLLSNSFCSVGHGMAGIVSDRNRIFCRDGTLLLQPLKYRVGNALQERKMMKHSIYSTNLPFVPCQYIMPQSFNQATSEKKKPTTIQYLVLYKQRDRERTGNCGLWLLLFWKRRDLHRDGFWKFVLATGKRVNLCGSDSRLLKQK